MLLEPVSLTVDQAKIDLYAAVSDDFNPIHVDPAFAAQTAMGGVIAHGTMSLNLIWQSLARSLPELDMEGVTLDVRFLRPVRIGDTIASGGERRGDGAYDVWISNQRDEQVIAGTLVIAAQQDVRVAASD
jgi:3-hydroxybutyryl-CoA dehydratase